MYYPTREEFLKLSDTGNIIPVYREIVADLETPVSAFLKLGDSNFSFLLESVEGGEKVARYSFLGNDPYLLFKSKNGLNEVIEDGVVTEYPGDPLEVLEGLLGRYQPVKVEGLPRFYGGAVGYMSYDMVRYFEKLPEQNPDDLELPDCYFMFTDTILVFDHVKHKIKVVSNAVVNGDPVKAYEKAISKIDALVAKMRNKLSEQSVARVKKQESVFKACVSKEQFTDSVIKAKEYIKAGDIFQVVLSQRFETQISSSPFEVYRSLRMVNPSPYMYYLKFGDFQLVGSSPEVLVTVEDGIAEVRPIAGTRPRGKNAQEDKQLEVELLQDEKEKAEHIMLVDLGRNDIGRVCDFGSVNVDELMVIERYSHVMHIVSNVSGKLAKGQNNYSTLRACFPAGTVSGAPKIRAMEIIEELEVTRRGPYAGTIGYFSFGGELDSCITIRTMVIKGDKVYIQSGAGIVADSDPEKEYEETLNKARALFRAVEIVEKGEN